MKRAAFTYHLPAELIAQEPRQRGRARMLVVAPQDGEPLIEHDNFANFPARLDPADVLVINDTRVIPARLFARPKGQMKNPIEVLLVQQRDPLTWEAWCKPARRVRVGDELRFSDSLAGSVLEKGEGTIVVRFEGDTNEIERIGVMPLPPYIARPSTERDRDSYQTVYAQEPGAIAAPTAGLHFTREMLDDIGKRNEIVPLTLHVGVGTFEPVKVEDVRNHVMRAERYQISKEAARKLNAAKSIVAVGTTTVRALESAKRAGRFEAGRNETNIFIIPGYEFCAVDKLLTNFHLPESTLLMLVSAFAGMNTIRRAYQEAISHRYHFYSYGDCMFIPNRGRW